MPKFEKQYVHFMWSDELEGKKGFFADNIDALINIVTTADVLYWGRLCSATPGRNSSYPFTCEDTNSRYKFFYFDPDLHVNEVITNRELAQWLAEGYGQFTYKQGVLILYHHNYAPSIEDMPIHEDIRVRLWGDTAWHTPTRAYMGLKE